jgi:hypothetical protein
MKAVNEPIRLLDKGLSLRQAPRAAPIPLSGVLRLVWQPSPRIEFEGEGTLAVDPLAEDVTLVFASPLAEAPVILSEWTLSDRSHAVRLTLTLASRAELVRSASDIDGLTFYLANFPEYFGALIKRDDQTARSLFRGRIDLQSPTATCWVDEIPEVSEIRRQARRNGVYIISHVGKLFLSQQATHQDIEKLLGTLHLFFGFLCGSWCGPLLPKGFYGAALVWEQLATWSLSGAKAVTTWLPQRSPLDLSSLFEQFLGLSRQLLWEEPLRTALGWYVAANSPDVTNETSIVLSQIALEMLAFVELVEVRALFPLNDFNDPRQYSAAKRIRALLSHLKIPMQVPSHLVELPQMVPSLASDGPEAIVYIRNRLVHATARNRANLANVTGIQMLEAAQLGLNYFELVLLALLGYSGKYARRAWRGWKGDDETDVPWVLTGP